MTCQLAPCARNSAAISMSWRVQCNGIFMSNAPKKKRELRWRELPAGCELMHTYDRSVICQITARPRFEEEAFSFPRFQHLSKMLEAWERVDWTQECLLCPGLRRIRRTNGGSTSTAARA
jgi:hypothetical protein